MTVQHLYPMRCDCRAARLLLSFERYHLLIVVGAFAWAIKSFRKIKYGYLLHVILCILFTWFFVFIEGATPSVLRAAIVLTIIVSSEIFQRKYDAYNALTFAAFLLLIINPYNLFDAGFLLTFTALLSIRLFYKMIYKVANPKNKIVRFFWSIISLSLAAQILALPFILYFFHRFPLLFIVGNIVAMPLAAIIIYLEILMMIFSPISFASKFIGNIIQQLILFLYKIIHSLSSMHFAVIEQSSINSIQVVMLVLFVFAVYFFVKTKNKNSFVLAICCLLSCIIINISQSIQQSNRHLLIVYNIPKHIVIDFVNAHALQSFSDTIFDKKSDEFNFAVKPARDLLKLKFNKKIQDSNVAFPKIIFCNKTIFVLNNQTYHYIENASNTDVVIISKNKWIDFNILKNNFPHARFVFTNENSMWKIQKWKTTCDSLHLQSYATSDGAFVMNL